MDFEETLALCREYGMASRRAHADAHWDDVEDRLRAGWDARALRSGCGWGEVRCIVRAAWNDVDLFDGRVPAA